MSNASTSGAATLPVVVIVEDQEAIVEVLSQALADAGLAPQAAPSATEAANFAREVGAAVVLLDVMMPDISGWAVLEQLRAHESTRDLPVIVTSAVYGRPGLHALPAGGPVRFMPKPFDIAEIVDTINGLIEQ